MNGDVLADDDLASLCSAVSRVGGGEDVQVLWVCAARRTAAMAGILSRPAG